jgi:hypothetical protein
MHMFMCSSKPSNSMESPSVTTLTLGLRPKQRVARLWAKRDTRESHHMLPGVQRVWRHEPLHSQVKSHVGSWNPKWTPKFSECNCRGQNSLPWRFLYIIAHLNIYNTSYGQKKRRESNSRPLKVKNWLDFLAFKQRARYHWKALNKGYNLNLDLIAIGGFHKKLCAFKVVGIPTATISGLLLGIPGTKNHLDVALLESCRVYYKGEGGGFPFESRPWCVLWVRVARDSS